MNIFDIIILACLVIFVFTGLKKGFIRELFDLLSFFIAFLIAVNQMSTLVRVFAAFLPIPTTILTLLSFLILFIGFYLLITLAGRILTKMVRIIFLGWLDRLGGAVFSLVKGGLLVSIVIYLISLLPLPKGFFEVYERSLLVPPFKAVAPVFFNCMAAILPGVQSFYQEFKQSITNSFSPDYEQLLENDNVKRFLEFVSGSK